MFEQLGWLSIVRYNQPMENAAMKAAAIQHSRTLVLYVIMQPFSESFAMSVARHGSVLSHVRPSASVCRIFCLRLAQSTAQYLCTRVVGWNVFPQGQTCLS